MKKILCVSILFLFANTALPKDKKSIFIMLHPCFILYKNMNNYLMSHGYSECESQEVCAAALTACLSQ
jgi:hypothetical protein